MQINKINDMEIEVTKETPVVEPVKTVYNLDFLYSQRESIVKSANDFVALRQVELDEVNALIAGAESAGVITKVEAAKRVDQTINIIK
jgi:hypothetical protein